MLHCVRCARQWGHPDDPARERDPVPAGVAQFGAPNVLQHPAVVCTDRSVVRVILEHALLSVRPGHEAEFEAAFAQARTIIAGMPGFAGLALSRCLERPSRYLLLVHWERLEDHTEGFRGSPDYERWRALLHHFYEPFHTVEHFTTVESA